MSPEPTVWFTSDWHLGHSNIIKYCQRPFSSVDEMDDTIIENCNALVKPTDTLYILGDFSFRADKAAENYRRRINCEHVHLIYGNHDERYFYKFFETAKDYAKIYVQKQKIILFHYPIAVWDSSHHQSWHLFGHSHGTHTEWREQVMPNSLSMDVGVDCNDYKPLSFERIRQVMNKRQQMSQA